MYVVFRFSENHSPESVLHFDDLMQLLNVYDTMNVFLLVAPSHKQVVERFCEYIARDENRLKRMIVCSRSPILIYQVRRLNYDNYELWHRLHFIPILHLLYIFEVAQSESEFSLWSVAG